jgi:hypothetical protein
MPNAGAVEQTLLDVQAYWNANYAGYLAAIDARLKAPTFDRGSIPILSMPRYPAATILQDPDEDSVLQPAANMQHTLGLGYQIYIALRESRPDQVETNMARYIDAAIDLMRADPTMGGISDEASLSQYRPIPPDPEGKLIGVVAMTVEVAITLEAA